MNTGLEFRTIRESRGLTIDRISSVTKIPIRYLEALERDDLRALPPRPYLRGFVAAYGRELGLDPAETVTRYFAQLGPPPAEPARAAHVLEIDDDNNTHSWAIAAVVVAVLLTVPAFSGWRSSNDTPQREVAGTSGTAPGAATVPAAGAAAPTDQGAVVPGPDLVVSLAFARPCWITASTDGTRVVYRLMQPGSTQVLKAHREIAIRVGDAGAVTWIVNGRAPAPMGGSGEVRRLVLTRDNVASIK